MKLAAIDIGSNSIHMIVAHIHRDGTYEVINKAREMVGLASRTLATGYLSDDAIERGLECLHVFKKMLDAQGIDAIVAVATSAVREAANGEYFVEKAKQECGIDVQIISGEEEARLIYLGAREQIDWGERRALIVDIGGGSVEFIVGDQSAGQFFASLKLGVRRLSEEFLSSDPPTRKQLKALRARIEETLGPFTKNLRKSHDFGFVVGTSGTLKSIAEIIHRQDEQPFTRSHGLWVTLTQIRDLGRHLSGMTALERAQVPGLDAKRVDTIIAGAQLIKYILRSVKSDSYFTCNFALRDGLVVDYIQRYGAVLRAETPEPDIRRRSVLRLFRQFNNNGAHPKQVARIALSLFDQLADPLKLSPDDRELLEFAALLHDIGYAISHRKHHKHSAYLILHGELFGFSPEEVQLLATIARYHRGSNPREHHEPFRFFTEANQRRVLESAALLRLANALDRSHTNNVARVTCSVNKQELQLQISTRSDPQLELWALHRNAPLFSETFGLDVTASHDDTPSTDAWIL